MYPKFTDVWNRLPTCWRPLVFSMLKKLDTQEGRRERRALVYSTNYWPAGGSWSPVWLKRLVSSNALTCWRFQVSCMLKRLDTQEGRRERRAVVYRTDYWPDGGSLVTSMLKWLDTKEGRRDRRAVVYRTDYWPAGGSLVTSMLKRLDTQEGRRERRALVYRTDYWPAGGSLVTSMLKRLDTQEGRREMESSGV